MAELNGYLLTKEEEKTCIDLIKKLRGKKVNNIIVEKRIAFLRQMDDYIFEFDSLWDV